nr:unnamed protein product [Callosobruchus analis]
MKLTAVPQLLLLTVAAVRAAPPLLANHERRGCSHGSAQTHPVEVKQSNLKETQFMLDLNDMQNLEQEEKFAGDKLRNQYLGRDFGKEPYMSDPEHNVFDQHMEGRPNHLPCHTRHTDLGFNSANDPDSSAVDHQSLIYKRDASSTTASPHLDVLNPVDKVYDAPVPELKGGVRRRAAEEPSTTTEEVRIKWVPPPEVMPVSEDYEEEQARPIQNKMTIPNKYHQKMPPSKSGRRQRREDVRRKRSEEAESSSHLPPKHTDTSEATTSTFAPKKRSLDKEVASGDESAHTTSAPKEDGLQHEEAPKDDKKDTPVSPASGVKESATSEPQKARRRRSVEHDETTPSTSGKASPDEGAPTPALKENSPHVKRSTEHEEAPKEEKKDTPVSPASGVKESATSEPKTARRRRSVEHDETTPPTSGKASRDEGAPTPALKENSPHVKRSTEHEEAPKDEKKDTPVSPASGVKESATSEPQKARRRRSVEYDETTPSTSDKASPDEGAPTPALKENSPHVKRSTEHEEAPKDEKKDTPVSPASGVKESATSEPQKARRRRSVEHDETTPSTSDKASPDEGAPTPALKENSPHVKPSTEHEEAPKDEKKDTPVSPASDGTQKTICGTRRNYTPTSGKASRDEGAPTPALKENSPHVKRSTEHEEAPKDEKKDTPVSPASGVKESATSEPKTARRRRSVEHDETTPSTSGKASSDEGASTPPLKENSPHVKRSTEHEEAPKDEKKDTPVSPASGVKESATSEPKTARRRRSVEHDETTPSTSGKASSDEGASTPALKENSSHVKRSTEHEEAPKDEKKDTPVSPASGVKESATSEPQKARRRRSVEHDETTPPTSGKAIPDEGAPTPALKENSPHDEKKDTPVSPASGVKEPATSEPKTARRRRSVEHDETTPSTSGKASSDEGASTPALKENSSHVKRSTEHEEAPKDEKKDTPVSPASGVKESVTSEPQKARRRRYVDHDETTPSTSGKAGPDEGASTPALKENSPHDEKKDTTASPASGVTESATPEPQMARRRRSEDHDGTTPSTSGKASSDEGASALKENSPHVKRSTEHEEAPKDEKKDTPVSPLQKARRRRSVEYDETTPSTSGKAISDEGASTPAPKETSPHVKRSTEHEEAYRDEKKDTPVSPVSGVTESATSESKKARRRRSVGGCSHTSSASKDNKSHVKRSQDYEGTTRTSRKVHMTPLLLSKHRSHQSQIPAEVVQNQQTSKKRKRIVRSDLKKESIVLLKRSKKNQLKSQC